LSITLANQVYVFLWAVAGGMLAAFLYDIFRIKRRAIKTNRVMTSIEDMVYWILVAVIMFWVVYISNEGEIRGYIFFGSILGVILYVLLFSRLVVSSALFVIRIVYRVVSTIWFILTYPFRLIFRLLSVPGRWSGRQIRRACSSSRRAGRDQFRKLLFLGKRLKNLQKKI
jgi:spore cortex biosynthesis protein YabQ